MASGKAIVHVVPSLNLDTGGPARSVSSLASALTQQGSRCAVATLEYAERGARAPTHGVDTIVVPADRLARYVRGYSRRFARVLDRRVAEDCRIVHGHGLWMYPNLCARKAAVRHRVPLVISPRGMLEAWSLERGRFKKMLAWRLYEAGNLSAASMLHATSAEELQSIRGLGLRQPVALIRNGVDVPDPATLPARELLERCFPALHGKRWLLFLSRIHPKKGLDDLVRAWAVVAREFPDVHLVVAGTDSEGHWSDVERDARDAGLGERMTYAGTLIDAEKACALGHSAVLVLPTRSENFGLVIAESLAHGTPVITTTAAPWAVLREQGCGWWIDGTPDALLATLRDALSLPQPALRDAGARGRALMLREFSWSQVAREMAQAYDWLVSGGEPPACVDRASARGRA
jgi:glycosyltransferase involved in cell wall biosynthesis